MPLHIHFIYFGSNEIYFICQTCSIISALFCTKCCLFHNFFFVCSSNIFSINLALKFKHSPPPPSHLKATTCLITYFCDEICVILQVNLHYTVSQVGAMAVEDRTNPACIPTQPSTETGLIIGWKIPCQDARWKLPQQVRVTQSMFSRGCHQTAWSFITTTKARYWTSPESV